jgi:hypothetical protein
MCHRWRLHLPLLRRRLNLSLRRGHRLDLSLLRRCRLRWWLHLP